LHPDAWLADVWLSWCARHSGTHRRLGQARPDYSRRWSGTTWPGVLADRRCGGLRRSRWHDGRRPARV